MKAVPDQIARWVPARFLPLGTDGFGRSDTREALRRFFETDGPHVVVAVLASLAAVGDIKPEVVDDAIRRYDIDPEAADPVRGLTGVVSRTTPRAAATCRARRWSPAAG